MAAGERGGRTMGARIALWTLATLTSLAVLAFLVVLVAANTEWGREQARTLVLDQLDEAVDGDVSIGALEGNLILGPRLRDVTIVDSKDRPFVEAEVIAFRIALAPLLRQRIVLSQIALEGARVVLDEPPGEDWNFSRIFQTGEPDPDPQPGWGHWIEIRDLELSRTDVILRMAWSPEEGLASAEREERVRAALEGETLDRVVEVSGGYQSIMEIRDVEASIPRILAAHPDMEDIPIEIERLSAVAELFEAPAPGVIEDLSGHVLVGGSGLHVSDLRLRLPESEIQGDASVDFETSDILARVDARPVEAADLQFLYPPLPAGVGGQVQGVFRMQGDSIRLAAEELDLRAEEGRVWGQFDVTVGDAVRPYGADVSFEGLSTRTLEEIAPDLSLPVSGRMDGRIAAVERDNEEEAIQLDARVSFENASGGVSTVSAEGAVVPGEVVTLEELIVRLDPLRGDLIQALAPQAPGRGYLEGSVLLDGPLTGPLRVEAALTHHDSIAGRGGLLATGEVDLRGDPRLRDVHVGLDGVALELAGELVDGAPEGARLSGILDLEGMPTGVLQVGGDLTLEDPAAGESRLLAAGTLDLSDGLAFRAFQVAIDPLQPGSLRGFQQDLPVGGVVRIGALLEGPLEAGVDARILLSHEEGEERSVLEGDARVSTAGGVSASVDLEVHALSLVTAGRFAPAAELQGEASGRIRGEGRERRATLVADMRLPEGGELQMRGALDATEDPLGFDVELSLMGVDVGALSGKLADTTAIEGTLAVVGQGTDPETMTAQLVADLADVAAERERRVSAGVTVHDGLVIADAAEVAFGTADLNVTGSFGLRGDREGTLSYRLSVESLEPFAEFIEEGESVGPRPAVQAAALEEWEEALIEAARAAEVERLATGRRPEQALPETEPALVGVRRGQLSGSAEASGEIRGNTERFEAIGQLSVSDLLFAGQQVGRGTIGYEAYGLGGSDFEVSVDIVAEDVLAEGFAYERVAGDVAFRRDAASDSGSAFLSIQQTEDVRIGAEGTFERVEDAYAVQVEELALDFPDVSYRTSGPASLSWTPEAVVADGLRLEAPTGEVLSVDGRLPIREEADGSGLEIEVEGLDVRHVLTLLQDEEDLRGRISIDMPVEGSAARPRFRGEASLTDAWMGDVRLPDVRVESRYADSELDVAAEVVRLDQSVLSAEGTLPMVLGMVDVSEPRFPDEPLRLDARLDDLPLEAIAAFTDQVRDAEGRAWGDLSVAGTYASPEISGFLDIEAPRAYVEPLGVWIRDTAGSLRLQDDVLRVDSLVVHSGGPLRVSGEVDVAEWAAPGFDLQIEGQNVQVLDTRDIEMRVDASLTLSGPFEQIEATGEIRTRRGVIRTEETSDLAQPGPLNLEDPELFERVDPVLIAARDALVDPAPLLENVRVDVSVFVDRDVWIRAPDLNVEVFTPPAVGPLRVRMDGLLPANVSLEGSVQVDRGEYEFMGRRLDLSRGSATFVEGDGLDPLIRLTAEQEVQLPGRQPFDIRIILDGTLSALDTELESTAQPPLSETNLLSYLVFGQEAGTLLQQHGSTLSGQASAGGPLVGQFAARATQQFATVGMDAVLTEIETETARSAGLDVLHIKPSASTPAELFTGAAIDILRTTEVEAGRYVTPHLFLAGQARPTFVHPGARMEYFTDGGYVWNLSWQPRFLPAVPTLGDAAPERASVLGTVLFREWRF